MTIRALIIDNELREQARKIAEFSSRPENYYVPGPDAKVPGDNPLHVLQAGDFRCVFSWTKTPEDGIFRHFSLSVAHHTAIPNPVFVEELARLFGFKGGLVAWDARLVKDNVIVIAQKVDDVGV